MNWFAYCCVQCKNKLTLGKQGLCSQCKQQIERFCACGRCGMPLPTQEMLCGKCISQPPNWDHMVIVGRYAPPLSALIHRFKFQHQYWLAPTLARLLLLAWREARREHLLCPPEVIIPVPLHRKRQWQRGYNQACLLAEEMSALMNIPYQQHLLIKHKHTKTQLGLSSAMREKNLKNAFALTEKGQNSPYQSIALIDDVITTGATLNEVAKLWRQKGVKQIQVWGLARTL